MPSDTPTNQWKCADCKQTGDLPAPNNCPRCASLAVEWLVFAPQGDTPKDSNEREERQKLVDILKELQLDTMAVESVDKGDYDSDVEYLTAKLHWAEVQILQLIEAAERAAYERGRKDKEATND